MEIILVRHGLSTANQAQLFGLPNTALTAQGRKQAKQLAKRLGGLKIDAIYSSDMRRAIDTAMPIAKQLGKDVIQDKRLAEVDFGSWQGKPNTELAILTGKNSWELLDRYDYDFHQWHGEDAKEVKARVRSFLDELKMKDYRLVLIVCHGGIMRWLHLLITGQKISWQPNAEELYLRT